MAAAFEPDTPEEGVNRFELGVGFRLEIDPIRPQSWRRRPQLNELLHRAGRSVVGRCALGGVPHGTCTCDLAAAQCTSATGVLPFIRRIALGTPHHSTS